MVGLNACNCVSRPELACIATLLGSVLSLMFYSGAFKLGSLEGADTKIAEPISAGDVANRAAPEK